MQSRHGGGGDAVEIERAEHRFSTSSRASRQIPSSSAERLCWPGLIAAGLCPPPLPCKITPRADGLTFDWGGPVEALCLPISGPETFSDDHLVPPIWANCIAWPVSDPSRWYSEVPAEEWPIIGFENLQAARFSDEALTLHPHPQAWTDAGGDGAVVLSWQGFDVTAWFSGVRLVCGHAIERRLLDALAAAADLEIEQAAS